MYWVAVLFAALAALCFLIEVIESSAPARRWRPFFISAGLLFLTAAWVTQSVVVGSHWTVH